MLQKLLNYATYGLSAGVDLISGVTCKEPYEWVDTTKSDWEFNTNGRLGEEYRVSINFPFKFVLEFSGCS